MKKIIIFIIFIMHFIPSIYAQQKCAKITLKNGTSIIGVVKSFSPLESIVINVAGFDSTIPMDKVEKIEDLSISQQADNNQAETVPTPENPLLVTDNEDYPDSVLIDIAGIKYPFILVRGGDYLMGYDGDGSMGMDSEPVHRVKVTSFYISKWLLTTYEVDKLSGSKIGKTKLYGTSNINKISDVVKLIVNNTKIPLRLPLEAEWEYAARCSKKYEIFQVPNLTWELCLDNYAKYDNGAVITDPLIKGNTDAMVCRSFISKKNLCYKRKSSNSDYIPKTIRLVIKAKDILK